MYPDGESTLITRVIVSLAQELDHRKFVHRFERKVLGMGIDMELAPLGAAMFLRLLLTISNAIGQLHCSSAEPPSQWNASKRELDGG